MVAVPVLGSTSTKPSGYLFRWRHSTPTRARGLPDRLRWHDRPGSLGPPGGGRDGQTSGSGGGRIPRVKDKRRVSLHIILGKGQRGADSDAYFKSLLEACKYVGVIVDDSSRYVEFAPVTFSRDRQNCGTQITLLDL